MRANAVEKDEYCSVRTSEDDTSKDGLLEKREDMYQPRNSFWGRYRTIFVVQLVIQGLWILAVYEDRGIK